MLLQLSDSPPLYSLPPCTPPPTHIAPLFSSCPWVIHISSLASTFPILSLTSPCLFSTYHLCYLFPALFPPFSPYLFRLITLQIISIVYDSLPVLVVCLVCFLDPVVDSCEFVAILMFAVFFFFFLNKSL